MKLVNRRLRWLSVGALAAWFFDPALGRDRRARVHAAVVTTLDRARQLSESSRDRIPAPLAQRLDHVAARLALFVRNDDRDLAERVRREALDPSDGSHLRVWVRRGRVAVGGAMPASPFGADLEARIRQVPGVRSVELLAQQPVDL